jgi:lipopolysaccharide/colanic/teichoic acid biosynthesis glycosyltransferase
MTKRLFDLFFATFGLLFSGGIIMGLYLLASIDTKQSGFFLQKRIGRFGIPFTIYKIRTFGLSTEQPVSRFGSFLRNSKLDELPQLWNIFLGDMTFVGPRPDVVGYYDLLEGENKLVLKLKPGLTSLASIKYANEDELLLNQEDALLYNDEVIFPDKVKMNLEYYYDHSLFGDIKIIWKTIWRSKGA